MKRIESLAVHERPREKLVAGGSEILSDIELLALLLGTGNKQTDVFNLSQRLLSLLDAQGLNISAQELMKLDGIGAAKASLIIAALEFARRRIRPHGLKIRRAADVFPLVRHLADRKQEVFVAISLNGAHEVIAVRTITVGLLNSTQVHPREVFAEAITDRAAAVIVAHNHPSGDLTPSEEDIKVTRRLQDAGKIIGISLLDHIVFSDTTCNSLSELGLF